MPLTLRERTDHATDFAAGLLLGWRYWVVVMAAVLLFAAIGPFGTFEQASFWPRLIYWAMTMASTSLVAILVVALTSAAAPLRWRRSFAVLMGGALLSCLPNTLLVQALIPLLLERPAPGFGPMLLMVLPIGLTVGAVTWLVFERVRPVEDETEDQPNPLVERLPIEKRGPVVRMSAQDHYIEVVTTRGRELVLMRMADAAAAMGDAGLRIHRSHWIARDHVAHARRDGAQAVVTASDGAELPVSRSSVPALKEAGLI